MIAIDDLRVSSNMSKSAKGNTEEHGKNVKAKSGLNKSILDQGWYEFRRQLEYKQLWNGGLVVAVPAQYTSKPALAVVMYREITARHKLILSVSSVVTPTMRILLVH